MVEGSEAAAELAGEVGKAAEATGRCVVVAESLTGGALSAALASAADAGDWYAGGVVAYRVATKQRVLGVGGEAVVTPECAVEMARGVRRLLAADVSAALTGVGGPDPQEGRPPGTVFIAVADARGDRVFAHRFHGSPDEVVAAAVCAALEHLRAALV